MSGRDSYTPVRGSGGGVSDDACSKMMFESEIANIDDDIENQLTIGDRLDVSLAVENGTMAPVLFWQGRKIGGFTRNGHKLKSCLEKGQDFEAEVRNIDSGIVTVFVKAV